MTHTEKPNLPITFEVGKMQRSTFGIDGGMRTQYISYVRRTDTGQVCFAITGESLEAFDTNKELFIAAITAAGGLARWFERLQIA